MEYVKQGEPHAIFYLPVSNSTTTNRLLMYETTRQDPDIDSFKINSDQNECSVIMAC